MFESLKKKLAEYFIRKRFLDKESNEINFNNFFTNSIKILVIMPEDEIDFQSSFSVLKFLKEHKKSISILCLNQKINMIPGKNDIKIMGYNSENISKLNLPLKIFLTKFDNLEYDIILDLNVKVNLFCSSLTNYIKSKIRIGFNKNTSDDYYNFQVENDEIKTELSYRNLLNSLKMF